MQKQFPLKLLRDSQFSTIKAISSITYLTYRFPVPLSPSQMVDVKYATK